MATLWEAVRNGFWSPWFWLPKPVTWDDFRNVDNGIYHPQISDLLVPIPLAILLCVIRILFERYIARPFGRYCGLKDYVPKCRPYPLLEEIFRKKKYPDYSEIEGVSKQTDLSVRQIERWFRLRRVQARPNILSKFGEASWRFMFYIIAFWYGVFILYNKPWALVSEQWWKGYPHHHVSSDMYWYYAFESAFYISLIMSQCRDVRRKDFTEMTIHHMATLGLMFLSWSQNMVRVGCMVLVVHDAVDYWLEAGKMAKYIKKQRLCDTMFTIFVLVWILTRMMFFPFKIIRSTLFEAHRIVGFCNVYYVYNILLITLQILHIFWFYIIMKMSFAALKKGELGKDIRSASDEDFSDDGIDKLADKTEQAKLNNQNGIISPKSNGSKKKS